MSHSLHFIFLSATWCKMKTRESFQMIVIPLGSRNQTFISIFYEIYPVEQRFNVYVSMDGSHPRSWSLSLHLFIHFQFLVTFNGLNFTITFIQPRVWPLRVMMDMKFVRSVWVCVAHMRAQVRKFWLQKYMQIWEWCMGDWALGRGRSLVGYNAM